MAAGEANSSAMAIGWPDVIKALVALVIALGTVVGTLAYVRTNFQQTTDVMSVLGQVLPTESAIVGAVFGVALGGAAGAAAGSAGKQAAQQQADSKTQAAQGAQQDATTALDAVKSLVATIHTASESTPGRPLILGGVQVDSDLMTQATSSVAKVQQTLAHIAEI